MRIIYHALACAALFVTAAAGAQESAPQPKTIQLSRVVLNAQTPPASQRVKVGTICLFSGSPLNFGSSERTLSYERFERIFATTMAERRFNVIARSSNLFEGEQNGPGPDYLIGAVVRPQSVDICDSNQGQKGSFGIAVEWHIFDRSRRQVIETVTSQGTGRVERFQTDGLAVMFDQAFIASLVALIEQGALQRYLGTPAG